MTPEQKASQQIDALLGQCGWIIQDRSQTNLSAWPGNAQLKQTLCDMPPLISLCS
jgi:hypothetical protein